MRKYNPVFYVVTRAGRRTSEKDHWTKGEADKEAKRLYNRLKKWKDEDFSKIEVVKTAEPHLIY